MIQIFNRSHCEYILFPVVHGLLDKKEIGEHHNTINKFEEHFQNSGTSILKFFLHISKEKQNKRLEKRFIDSKKKWKCSVDDKREAKKWHDYMDAYENMQVGCGKYNPWIVVPADEKW